MHLNPGWDTLHSGTLFRKTAETVREVIYDSVGQFKAIGPLACNSALSTARALD